MASRSAVGLFREWRAGLLVMALVAAGCGGSPEERKQAFLESGDRYFQAEKYNEAVIEYLNAVQVDPRFAQARLKLAEAYVQVGDTPKAFAQYIRAADLLPEDLDVQLRAGTYLLAAGRPEDARAKADAVLERDPRSAPAHVLRANALAGLKDLEGAVKDLEEAIQLDPGRSSAYVSLGAMELARGQREQAEAALNKAVELSPEWAGGHLALANYHLAVGNAAEAERSLRAALAAEPENLLANRGLAAFSMAAGRPADAEPYLKRIAAASPAGALALADYYAAIGRHGEAVAQLRDLQSNRQVAAAAEERLVRALAASGARAEAHALADDLIKRNAKNGAAQLAKGQLLLEDGRREDALAHVRASVEAAPENAAAQFVLGKIYVARGDTAAAQVAFTEVLKRNPRAAAAQVELANLHLLSRQPEASTTSARQAIANAPGSLEARLALVRGLLAQNDSGAEAEIQALLQSHPTVPQVHVLHAVFRGARKEFAAARAAFDRALELDPTSLEAVGGLNLLDISVGNFAAAKARTDARLQAGETPAVLLLAARTYAAGKDHGAAERFLRRALEIEPTLLPAYSMLGQLYVSQRRLEEARREFTVLASRQTKPVAALTMIGMIHQMEGNQVEAKQAFEKVLAVDPNAAVAANNLAWMYAEKGENLDLALQLARGAVAAAPRVPEISDTLGWILYLKNLPDLAIAPLARAVELDPRHPVYHYHLGLAYVRNGDAVRGRESLQRAIALRSDFPGAQDARRALAALRDP